ncbi:MAG TPA: hypothetical protein VE871_12930 [Longimicrobium sp.]|nr:hypothetical protein [Longimicrobium sp.]
MIWKSGVGSIATHQNWRGQFSRGTWGEGTGRAGQSSDCTGTWPQQIECVPVPWPGWNTNAWHDDAAKPQTVGTETYWRGSLSAGMRDASDGTMPRIAEIGSPSMRFGALRLRVATHPSSSPASMSEGTACYCTA